MSTAIPAADLAALGMGATTVSSFAIGSPDGITAPPASGGNLFGFSDSFWEDALSPAGLGQLTSGTILPLYAEGNRHSEALRTLRANENIRLAERGFSTGRATYDQNLLAALFATNQRPAAPVVPNIGSGFGSVNLAKWIPYGIGALVLVRLLK